ncbi:MAG: nucleoside-triphosphatase [Acidobacteriota bacterium]
MTGRPGIGKTTVIRAVSQRLPDIHPAGFYTEEIRAGRVRRGFRLVTFEGETAVMADVDFRPPRVGKYGVEVATIDRFAAKLPEASERTPLCLIDEIGKMECLSTVFVRSMRRMIESDRTIVATVGERGGGFIDEVKRHDAAELWRVTETTRNGLPDRVVEWIDEHIRPRR